MLLKKNIFYGKSINYFINTTSILDIIKEQLIHITIKPPRVTGNILKEYFVDSARIVIAEEEDGLRYFVHEPEIDIDVAARIISCLYINKPKCDRLECVIETVERSCREPEAIEYFYAEPNTILYHYCKIKSGYGVLYPIILDDGVEEAEGNEEDGVIRVIHREMSWYGWMPTNIKLKPRFMEKHVLMLARKIGRHLSLATPIAEGLTREGARLALTYGREVSRKGSSFVMRKKRRESLIITSLINSYALTPLQAAYLWLVLDLRGSIIIAGPMGSGKTTLLQALLTLIPPSRRVVTIEDTPEITGSTGLWDPLVARPALDDRYHISLRKLLKFSMRRRADYIIVGEVRGEEARLLIQASRLGHGIATTMHAETPEMVFERLSSHPINIPLSLLRSIWAIVIMNPTGPRGERYVKAIYEPEITGNGIFNFNKIFSCRQRALCEPTVPQEVAEYSRRLLSIMDKDMVVHELTMRSVFLSKLASKGVTDANILARSLMEFYMNMGDEDAELAEKYNVNIG